MIGLAILIAAIQPATTQHWSFRNHVLPVLTKAGCNGGACHGALAGKGGLKLSLRGFDPVSDYNILTRQSFGRRVIKGRPDFSLMVQKPTMMIGHGGGERIKPGSIDYQILAGWIKSGAIGPAPADPQLVGVTANPAASIHKPGESQQITVTARYSNGKTEDVTRWVKFGTSDSMVATVDDLGKVKCMGSGEAAITIWFNSKVTFARVVSPFPSGEHPGANSDAQAVIPNEVRNLLLPSVSNPPGKSRFLVPRNDELAAGPVVTIDSLISAKLSMLNLPASPRCTDSEFIRRAFLDCCGILPTPEEVESFLKDSAADKRLRLVDSLLARLEFVDYWTNKWCDLFLVSSRKLSGRSLTAFYNWIRASVQENKPWDKLAREILTARGSSVENGAANYFVLHKDPIDLTETTTQAFLGMSIQCCRCHNHPLEKWTQRDYYQFANLFGRVRLKNGDQNDVLVLAANGGDISHPRLGVPLPPRPLDGSQIALDDSRDRRQVLADWLTSPDNPYFAKAIVNRVWRSFMGRGLVEAEDDLRMTNPPSNQELFDYLAKQLRDDGYDLKKLMRRIMLSEAYQRSSTPEGMNAKDDRYYSRYIVRRLPAEVILDSVSQVTGIPTSFEGYPKGTRALQLRDSAVSTYFLTAFGRPERINTCSCERQQEPSVAQALHLANGDTLNEKLRAASGTIESLLKSDDVTVLNRLYLAALSRYPSEAEKSKLLPLLVEASKDSRRAGIEDVFWAILTDREFLFNH